MVETRTETSRQSLYAEVTARVIDEMEQGRLPWVQPWHGAACSCTMPHNAGSGRFYSGINVLILWSAVIEGGYSSQSWLTYQQAQTLGGHVRRGETGVTICYADRFTPKSEEEAAETGGRDEGSAPSSSGSPSSMSTSARDFLKR
jgi:antirestriction protein ArdC